MAPARQRSAALAPVAASVPVAVGVLLGLALLVLALFVLARPASAHVVPTSSIQLAVSDTKVVASVDIPLADLESASGIDLGNDTQAEVDAHAEQIETYLLAHFTPTTDDGAAWTVTGGGGLSVMPAGDAATTGRYQQLSTTFTLSPPTGEDSAPDVRSFNLGYDAVVDKIATHTVIVTISSDAASDDFSGAYEVGTVRRSTVTNAVQGLHVQLGSGTGTGTALRDMATLGMQHIREGTDHQLFLLTLLLPAPLLVRRRHWATAAGGRRALRRIATVTLSFTLGHSITLALGALGVPVPQQLVEAAIALSILVAAVHAVRPIFPGREAMVAGGFGLVHGLAFSEALRALDLSGAHLVLALLGFNLGIEAMQLIVVALVLPPLVLLARSDAYARLRVVAAVATGIAALGWLGARLGQANPLAAAADRLGSVTMPVLAVLWLVALVVALKDRAAPEEDASRGPLPRHGRLRGRAAPAR